MDASDWPNLSGTCLEVTIGNQGNLGEWRLACSCRCRHQIQLSPRGYLPTTNRTCDWWPAHTRLGIWALIGSVHWASLHLRRSGRHQQLMSQMGVEAIPFFGSCLSGNIRSTHSHPVYKPRRTSSSLLYSLSLSFLSQPIYQSSPPHPLPLVLPHPVTYNNVHISVAHPPCPTALRPLLVGDESSELQTKSLGTLHL